MGVSKEALLRGLQKAKDYTDSKTLGADGVVDITTPELDSIFFDPIEIEEHRSTLRKTTILDWQTSTLSSSTGEIGVTTDGTRAITSNQLSKDIIRIETALTASLFAYDENGEYVGVWNGSTFVKSAVRFTSCNFDAVRMAFPEYQYYIVVLGSNAVESAKTGVFIYVGTDYTTTKETIVTGDPVTAMVDVAESYFNVAYDPNDLINYKSYYGLYGINTEFEGVKMIQCTELLYALLTGTYYQSSRYVTGKNGNNYPSTWGWSTDGSGEQYSPPKNTNEGYIYSDYLQAQFMAKYFDAKGLLSKYSPDHNNLHVGDLLFVGNETNNPSNYKGIAHAALVVMLGNNGFYTIDGGKDVDRIVADGKSAISVQFWSYSTDSSYYYVSCPLGTVTSSVEVELRRKIRINKSVTSSASNSYIVGYIGNLNKGFHTIVVDVDPDEDVIWRAHPYYSSDNNGKPYDTYDCAKDRLTTKRFFVYIQQDNTPVNLRAMQSTGAAKMVGVNSITVYKGYVGDV